MINLMENKAGKNLHLEHIEDEILNFGVDGGRGSINFLRSLRDMLAGASRSSVNMTVKWDGAPAIFAGTDPADGKFFVAKKSVFNVTPKLYKTEAEINEDLSGISTLAAPVGEPRQFGTLEVTVQRCVFHPPEATPENAAFVVIRDLGYDPSAPPTDVFSGWMFSSSPANRISMPTYIFSKRINNNCSTIFYWLTYNWSSSIINDQRDAILFTNSTNFRYRKNR